MLLVLTFAHSKAIEIARSELGSCVKGLVKKYRGGGGWGGGPEQRGGGS